MKLMDCTLRDGGNVVGRGFDAELTKMMIEGLIASNITVIEMGNCTGIGSYEASGSIAPCTDVEYLEVVKPYLDKAEIGMFVGWKNATDKNVNLAKEYGLNFLRVGANAGDGKMACDAVKKVKEAGMVCRYSLMKAYVLSAEELADEAVMLEACGLDEITIMDSAGTMTPDQVSEYVKAMVGKVKIPVAFHGHNNLGLSVANALAAEEAGATVFDCGLLGMARSAGNCATELAAAAFQRRGMLQDVDLLKLLEFEDKELIPAMEKYNYHVAVKPFDLILGLGGAHSSFTKLFEEVAEEKNVNLYKLILEVSKINQKNPDRDPMERDGNTDDQCGLNNYNFWNDH
ncbi:MAG: 4-hydroxy-2-oxovalerate aldolase [Clostridia bacterium]|nr:4-hydroxy-2-oxovalerate aldolase [Clostridia bacterium]NCC44286.1 4-hydroxy-2-oxovalerate aldolase [Clostridia bacterium]